MKKTLNYIFFLILCMNLEGCKKIINTTENLIGKKTLSKGGEEISKEAAEKSAKELGNSYVGKSVGHQLVRNAVRRKVEEEMKEDGVKSFLQLGTNKASKELAHLSFPSAKSKMLNDNAYQKHIIASRLHKNEPNPHNSYFKNAITKETIIVTRKEGKDALDYLSNHNKELKELVDKIIQNPRSHNMKDHFVVEITEDGRTILSHSEQPNCRIEVNGNIVKATAGSRNKNVYKGINYGLNEFLSYRLPNKTYIIDDYMTINTDELGRVKETTAIFEKAKIVQRMRNTPEQNRIVESQGGVIGKDDGGHLIQMAMGGPNELINQVPMNGQMNKGGIWRMVENYEIEQGWKQGKKVTTKRRPIYKGDSGRPIAIEVDVIVDGKHAIIDGKQCPFLIPNE